MSENYKEQARLAMQELIDTARLEADDIVVVGCSTSEVMGEAIGTAPAPDVAKEMFAGFAAPVKENGLRLAIQCCEHLDRALVVEASTMRHHGLVRVNALPVPKAGGSLAAAATELFDNAVTVEALHAAAGLDVGGTLIGMHLRPVVVPVRLQNNTIGKAAVAAARTRPKLIGGVRARYDENLY